LLKKTAYELSKGKIVAWMQGQAEFSPRALGHRSILADPRISDLKKTLNLKIKFRESFRPFAPAVLAEEAHNWFEMDYPSPLMNFVCKAKQGVNNLIPSVIHEDETARVQTVAQDTNRLFHQLLSEFHNLTACPILVNTSFNIRGEPMVLSPKDAFNCLMNTGIDILVIGNFYIEREKQGNALFEVKNFELD
jgi:carbamoyltransferase